MKFVEDLLIYMYTFLHLLNVLSKQVARQQSIDRLQQAKGCSRLTVKMLREYFCTDSANDIRVDVVSLFFLLT